MSFPPALRVGASSWTAPSWQPVFYPPGSRPADFLPYYAQRYDTVEIDATFYRAPDARTVDGWRDRTPPGFLFAAKTPQVITHEKMLVDCGEEWDGFVKVMDRLGDRLGPILLQFRYFRKDELPDPKPFLDRLEVFLPRLIPPRRYAVEVRTRRLLTPRLYDLLARHGVALALIDHPWMPRIGEMLRDPRVLTADFVYLRWLGDRKGIEKITTTWDRTVVDRDRDLRAWVPAVRSMIQSGRSVFGYFNNHYSGYAIGSIEHFRGLWDAPAGGGEGTAGGGAGAAGGDGTRAGEDGTRGEPR
jgi:uncharacterized protein YecE (DUF72 family)